MLGNSNTVPTFKKPVGSSVPPPPIPTVNWKMMLESADGVAYPVGGFNLTTTGVAGTNDIFTATKGAIIPVSWIVSAAAQAVVGFDFSGTTFIVPSTGDVEALLLEMTNTNTLPIGTVGAGPDLVVSTTGGVGLNVNTFVQTLGSAAPGIQTQSTAGAQINVYLIQL